MLRLVHSEPEIEAVEADVLARAIADMGQLIEALPSTSSWRLSFIRARSRLQRSLAELRPES
jgi:hypothetical protein